MNKRALGQADEEGGFAIIVSVLMLATVILIIATTSILYVTGQQAQSISLESYQLARAMSESCADVALLKRTQNPAYTGNETVTVGTNTCSIKTITNGPPVLVTTEAYVNGYVYRLHIELTSTDPPTISKWQRVSSF